MATFPVVLDACVLYPITLTDLWMRCDLGGLFRAHWSPEILDEVRRNLTPTLDPTKVDRRIAQMDKAIPGASVSPPQSLIDTMTNHPKDRHVLATAVAARADVIVTDNTKDFPPSACDPLGVEIQTSAEFAEHLASLSPVLVAGIVKDMAASRKNPPTSVDQMTDRLRRLGLSGAVEMVEPHLLGLR